MSERIAQAGIDGLVLLTNLFPIWGSIVIYVLLSWLKDRRKSN